MVTASTQSLGLPLQSIYSMKHATCKKKIEQQQAQQQQEAKKSRNVRVENDEDEFDVHKWQ